MEFTDELYVSDLIKKIFTPLLLVVGLLGNSLSITIFSRKCMSKYTTFRFLKLLSIIDICSLYIGLGQIMFDVYFNIDLRLVNQLTCKLQSFLVYFFTHFSSMLLAFMSIDRYIIRSFQFFCFNFIQSHFM